MTRSAGERALRPGHGPKPAFLKPREIEDLAARLNVGPGVVAIVLQVAGHVLRERYRRRGWIPPKRDPAVHNAYRVERDVVAAAIEEATG